MTRYELIDPAGAHHHHLLCDSCGRLVPFDDGDLERSIDRLSRRLGFDTHDHEVILRGDCSACQAVAVKNKTQTQYYVMVARAVPIGAPSERCPTI